MSTDATIKVPVATRDRLAALAREQETTIGALVSRLAEEQPTAEQIAERVAATRRYLRERLGATLTDDEFNAVDMWEQVRTVAARRRLLSAKGARKDARGSAA